MRIFSGKFIFFKIIYLDDKSRFMHERKKDLYNSCRKIFQKLLSTQPPLPVIKPKKV